MSHFRIAAVPGLTTVNVCRCPSNGLCVFVPLDITAGEGRAQSAALLTDEELAVTDAAFLAGDPLDSGIPAACPRRAGTGPVRFYDRAVPVTARG